MEISYTDKCYHASDEELICSLKETAELLGKDSLTIAEYDCYGKYNSSTVIRRFGTWNEGLSRACLVLSNRFYTDEELFENLSVVWSKLGKQPSRRDLDKVSSTISYKAYERRFGKWSDAVKAFVDFYNRDPDSLCVSDHIVENALANDKPARDVNLRLRFLVMQRDKFKCCICGASPAKDPNVELQIDHIVPWSKGGKTTIDNLQTLCHSCNLGKSNL